MIRWRTLATLLCTVLLPAWATAAQVTHRIGESETLETVAKSFYGKSWKAVYLRTHNKIPDDAADLGGRWIKIPASWTYKVRRGDTASKIAKRYLSDANRYKAILEFNGIKDPGDLEVGTELLMPFHLFHIAAPGDSLSKISRRYYRTTRRATMLKQYNGVEVLKPNAKIVVPIFDRDTVEVASRRYVAKSGDESRHAPAEPPISAAETEQRLRAAIRSYYAGDFDEACDELEILLENPPADDKDKTRLIQYLGFCEVAFGNEAAARDYFRKWIEIEPTASLNPVTTSPKILALFLEVVNDAGAYSSDEGTRTAP